ncbi:hypothetical protein [Sphingomonas sanguinis]|uniref:RraA family protein n=1 Tax=Sphingomonas sanguinis TaxID=33051 RepID=UPI002E19D4C0
MKRNRPKREHLLGHRRTASAPPHRRAARRRVGNVFPVVASGVTHHGPYKDGPGEVNVPIAIEGMVIRLGDLLLGHGDRLVGALSLAGPDARLSEQHAAELALPLLKAGLDLCRALGGQADDIYRVPIALAT